MQRRSLFAPIFLMALGAVLLAANLRSDLSIGLAFATYWPWILVIWGSFRMVEHVAAGVMGQRGPRRMGAGAVLLTIFLCFAGSISHAFYQSEHGWWRFFPESHEFFGEVFEFPLEQKWEVPGATALELDGLRGTFRVRGTEGDSVNLMLKRSVQALDRESAQDAADEVEVSFSDTGSNPTLAVLRRRRTSGPRVREDLTLEVPRRFNLMIRDASGDLRVSELEGGVKFDGAGDLRLSTIDGPVELKVRSSGRVEASDLGSSFRLDGSSRHVDLDRVVGAVDIKGNLFAKVQLGGIDGPTSLEMRRTLARIHALPGRFEVEGNRVELEGASGAVQLESKGTRQIRLNSARGTSRITSERGKIEIEPADTSEIHAEIDRGNIEVRLNPYRPFRLEASVKNGDIVNRLADDDETFKGSLELGGNGPDGPSIQLKVGRGKVTLKPI